MIINERGIDVIQEILMEHHKNSDDFKGEWRKLPMLKAQLYAWAEDIEQGIDCVGAGRFSIPALELKSSEHKKGWTETYELLDDDCVECEHDYGFYPAEYESLSGRATVEQCPARVICEICGDVEEFKSDME